MKPIVKVVYTSEKDYFTSTIYILTSYQYFSFPKKRNNEYASDDSEKGKIILKSLCTGKKHFIFREETYHILSAKFYDDDYLIKLFSNSDFYVNFPRKEWLPTEFKYDYIDENYSVYVYRGKRKCDYEEHIFSTQYVLTRTLQKAPLLLKCIYCKNCDQFFISEKAVELFISKNIFPLNKLKYDGFTYYEMRERSELSLYGYTVRKPRRIRQQLLYDLIENDILSYKYIYDHISWLIDYHWNQETFENAITEWTSDLKFLQNLPPELDGIVFGEIKK